MRAPTSVLERSAKVVNDQHASEFPAVVSCTATRLRCSGIRTPLTDRYAIAFIGDVHGGRIRLCRSFLPEEADRRSCDQ